MHADVLVTIATASTPATTPRATRGDVAVMLATIGEPGHFPTVVGLSSRCFGGEVLLTFAGPGNNPYPGPTV